MTITAEQLQVLQPVVGAIPIDVMKLHVQRPPKPFDDATELAAVLLQPLLDESVLEMSAIRAFPSHRSSNSIMRTNVRMMVGRTHR
jgi:hypothetical protein